VTRGGAVLGQHTGLANYTIGQRKGLGVASPVPLYVLGKDAAANAVIVGTQDELGSRELTARDVNWLSGETQREPFRAEVKIRYTAKEAEALVTPNNGNHAQVRFDAPQRDITAGQAAVFYQGDVLIGGGIIA
jgi:tRNA-uridine 2-sulfurtransferase